MINPDRQSRDAIQFRLSFSPRPHLWLWVPMNVHICGPAADQSSILGAGCDRLGTKVSPVDATRQKEVQCQLHTADTQGRPETRVLGRWQQDEFCVLV